MQPAKRVKEDEFLSGLVLNKEVIELPKRYRQGQYRSVLLKVLGLKATSVETGLNPCYIWNRDSKAELKAAVSALYQGRSQMPKDQGGKIAIKQQIDPDKNIFRIYLWHQE